MSQYRNIARVIALLIASAIVAGAQLELVAADWPTWRADANRSGATTEQLPDALHLQWIISRPRLVPAWPEDPRLQFDASYEPIVVGDKMIVASSEVDSVTAYDLKSASTKWTFFTEGPVRLAPVAADGRVYFGADDGKFYCLDIADGKLIWKFDAAPSMRKVLGNDRMISVWPVRGGPVLSNDKVYFTAGVWPFEGVFLYTLDMKSGDPVTGEPPRHIRTLRDTTPQGYLVSTGSKLYMPCGRSVAACLDIEHDQIVKPFDYSTSKVTNVHVSAIGRWLFHGQASYDVKERATLNISADRPVFTNDVVYFGDAGDVVAYDLLNPKIIETKDRKGRPQKRAEVQQLWRIPNAEIRDVPPNDFKKWVAEHPMTVHLKAGSRLFASQENDIYVIDLADGEAKPRVKWLTKVEGISSMLAANGKLIIIGRDGQMHCYGSESVKPVVHTSGNRARYFDGNGFVEVNFAVDNSKDVLAGESPEGKELTKRANRILELTGQNEGFALVLGIENWQLTQELINRTNLRVIATEPVPWNISPLEFRWNHQYGSRVQMFVGDARKLGLPPYFANLIVTERLEQLFPEEAAALAKPVYELLRPYGGTACFMFSQAEHDAFAAAVEREKLANAEIKRDGEYTILKRVGALPGSADWTHEFGDSANTLMSNDTLVKAPLGVLWYGGPAASGDLFYNRHEWGPSMAVIGGRMFMQGPGKLTAVDVYTGRILWKTNIEETGHDNLGRRGNDFENKLAGFHFLAVEDGVYLVDGRKGCLRFDPVTGKQVSKFTLPDPEADWGTIRVKDHLLIAEVFRTVPGEKKKVADEKLPVEIIAIDRHTGATVWTKQAELSFPVVAISDNRVYCFDGALENFYVDAKRKGLVPKASDKRYLAALDLKTGNEIWKYTTDTIVTWMNYSNKNDVLMVSNRDGMTAYRGQDGKELWKKYAQGQGFKGHPENLWDKVIVWNDWVIDQRGPGGAYNIETGDPVTRVHPVTGKTIPWEFTKTGHHCNYAVASPHLLTFRAEDAGFCDIASGETSRLKGFRSGCRNSLIPANGILNAPNYAHGCVCGFSLFTSLAFRHLPESEVWSYNALTVKAEEDAVTRIGINFGAPGDRLASNGTLWIDYPNVSGSSPAISVTLSPDQPRWFMQHSSLVEGDELEWVAASGFEGDATIVVTLDPKAQREKAHTVRLHFLEPEDRQRGERVFDVSLQGVPVLENFDIIAETGKPLKAVVKEFRAIRAGKDLKIDLKAARGKSVLCGVEILAEN